MSLLVSSSISLWRCKTNILGVILMKAKNGKNQKMEELNNKIELLNKEVKKIKKDLTKLKKNTREIYPPTQPGGESAGMQNQ